MPEIRFVGANGEDAIQVEMSVLQRAGGPASAGAASTPVWSFPQVWLLKDE
jgi:hypothetical protein